MISVTILVKNGERKLREVLSSLSCFDEIILYDTGSSDATLEIAKEFLNVKIYFRQFHGFGSAHNDAASLATHPWILSIDADEVLSPELAHEIRNLSLNRQCIYALPFHNYYNHIHVKWCGWYPEKHIRLYHKEATAFSAAHVHEGVIKKPNLKEVVLSHPVYHYPYHSISDFLIKMERYSTLFAEQYVNQRRSSPLIALVHGWGAFFKSYFLKKGFCGGYTGFLISAYNGHTAFYKYLKLYQANKKTSPPCY